MATARDQVWAAALRVGRSRESFKVDHVEAEIDGPSRRTVERTLRGMKETSIVEHRRGSPWYSLEFSTGGSRPDRGDGPPGFDPDADVGELREEAMQEVAEIQAGGQDVDEPSVDLEHLVATVDVPGWDDDVVADRRAALRLTLELLQERGPMKRAELLEVVYPKHPGDYDSAESLWVNFLLEALGELADEGHIRKAEPSHDDEGWRLLHR